MRILFLTDNFPPEVNAPARRTYEHCVEWVKGGNDVTIITCWPNFPRGVVYKGYRNKLYGRTDTDGIKVKRVWSYIARNEGFVRRTMDYLSFAFSSFLVGLFTPCDVIVATSPQFFTTFSARAISFIKRVPWVFELRDIWPESIRAVGAMNSDKTYQALEKIELCLYRNAALVIAVTPAFKENLIARGISSDHICVVPNGVNRSHFSERPTDQKLAVELGLEDAFVVGYVGTHGLAHSLDFVLRVCAKVKNERVKFLFVGDGAEKQAMLDYAAQNKLSNVVFHEPVSSEEVPAYLSVIDVALVPLKRSDTFLSVIPSKIFESGAMAKPILLGVDGQARSIVEEFGAGIFFEPENETDFLEKLEQLANDEELYRGLQRGCRALADAYDRRQLAQQALEYIESTQN